MCIVCVYIYIYICIERERDITNNMRGGDGCDHPGDDLHRLAELPERRQAAADGRRYYYYYMYYGICYY